MRTERKSAIVYKYIVQSVSHGTPSHLDDNADGLVVYIYTLNQIAYFHAAKTHVIRNENANVAIIIPTIINTPFIFMYII